MSHHAGRICSKVLRCFGCDAPIGSFRDSEEKVVMAKCSRCGRLQQRNIGWSSFNACAPR
jgi:hypothetical protein